MSYMEIVDPKTGKKQRRDLRPSSLKKYNDGISREQGPMGANRGADGWQSVYSNGVLNSLVNTATEKPGMRLNPITDSLLTQKGFNQALQNVQIRNLAKLADRRAKRAQGVLGSLIGARSQDTATAARVGLGKLDAKTRKYRIDTNAKTQADRLAEEKRYHDMTGKYNMGLLENQRRGQDLNYAARTAEKKPKEINPLDAAIKRAKLVPDTETFKTLLPEEIADEISDANAERARIQYLQTGKIPSFQKDDGLFDVDYTPTRGQEGRASGREPTPLQKISPDAVKSISLEVAKEYGVDPSKISIDYRGGLLVLPNGKKLSLSMIYDDLYGGR